MDIMEPRCHISSLQSNMLTDELMDDWDRDPEVTARTVTCLCAFVHCVINPLSYLVSRFH